MRGSVLETTRAQALGKTHRERRAAVDRTTPGRIPWRLSDSGRPFEISLGYRWFRNGRFRRRYGRAVRYRDNRRITAPIGASCRRCSKIPIRRGEGKEEGKQPQACGSCANRSP